LEAVFRVFAYIALHHNARVVFNPNYPSANMGAFIKTDWKSMYDYVKEMIPPMLLFPVGTRLTCDCLLILIMLVSSSQGIQ
jgi:hypothetical protein